MAEDYRKVCLATKGRECEICGATKNIVVHHVDGDRSNNHIDNPVPMCKLCHKAVHWGDEGYEQWHEQLVGSADGQEDDVEREQLTQRMPEDLVKDVDEIADHLGMSRNAMINMMCRRSIGEMKEELGLG
jgi:tRNA U54 and U55 pseudouridine synthase Pus10